MKALAVVTTSLYEKIEDKNKHLIEIDDLKIPLARVEGNAPQFDAAKEEFAHSVLVQKTAFSLNYRDLGVIEMAWKSLKEVKEDTYYPIGSDFSARVLEVGNKVSQFKKGDVVIANCSYPKAPNGVLPGIPSNHSSREFEVYNENKLVKVPHFISSTEASSLSIGTQTSMSMIRKANIKEGDNVMVTSITSNTSFFILNSLRELNCNVYGISYSGENIETVKKQFPFIKEVFVLKQNSIPNHLLFDVVFDAFSDTYLGYLSHYMNFEGRYLTCGIFNQSSQKVQAVNNSNLSILMSNLIARNISLIGNCLGSTIDLTSGLELYKENPMKLDTVFTEKEELKDFITKTYNLEKNKFGKVVYQYQ
jgi:NADPH:quinone reductase-like Zn-dependent oxidoreductase